MLGTRPRFINKKLVTFTIIVFFITIVIDTSFVKIYNLIGKTVISFELKLKVFAINTAMSLLFQIGLLVYLSRFFQEERFESFVCIFKKYYYIAIITLIVLVSLLSYMTIHLFLQHEYSKYVMIYLIGFCYASATLFFIMLGKSFYSWYRRNHKRLIFLYFLSIGLIVFNLLISMTVTILKISDKPEQIGEYVGITSFSTSIKYVALETIYSISSILSFVSLWITTLTLVTTYRTKSLRNVLFLLVLLLPLIYFSVNYILKYYITEIFDYFHMADFFSISLLLIIVFSLSNPIGGILFGILLWRTSRSVSYERDIVAFILISGYGIMLVFSSNQVTSLTVTPYPPFGLVTISLLPLAAYMMLMGLYNSAKLVSINNELRRSIVKIALESRMLNEMGEAENQKNVENIVSKIHEDPSINELESDIKRGSNLDDDELTKYVEEIMRELQVENQKQGDNNN